MASPWWLKPPIRETASEDAVQVVPAAEVIEVVENETPAEPSHSAEPSAEPPDGETAPAAKPARRRRRRASTAVRETSQDEPPRPRSRKKKPVASAEPVPDEESSETGTVDLRVVPVIERTYRVNGNDERRIALFCDLENIALGVRDSEIKKLDINLIMERLIEKGKIIVKKAYADWERYSEFKRPFHEAAIEMIDIPQKYYSGKNSADIKMAVDALELCYNKEHVDTFAILSGDSDFSPLVSKLRESNKQVIGVGVKNSSSNLLIDNCDEFLFYEDIWREQQKAPKIDGIAKKDGMSKKKSEAFNLMVDSIKALMRENKDVLWGSMIKQTMQRKRPSFNEGYHGYGSFSELLEDAERQNIIKLKKDPRSGTYVVTGFAGGR
jgi:uncharacterized protein (TIGR00288 family)